MFNQRLMQRQRKMARIRPNDKGYKLIEMSMEEIVSVGGYAVCDSCNRTSSDGVYVAVLNGWYCMDCFDAWYARVAECHPDDRAVELSNFKYMRNVLGI